MTNACAAGATLVSVAFACSTLERWLIQRRRHQLAWTVSLFMFAAGSLALTAGAALGWEEWSFRAFYLFGGVLNVPFLALGTVYLLRGTEQGDRWAAGLGLVAAFAAGIIVVAPLTGSIDPSTFPSGKAYFGILPRVLAGVGSAVASLVIVGGALWSAASLLRRRHRHTERASPVTPGRLALANVLIALGTLVVSAKGAFEGLGDEELAFAAALATGITIIFAGFLLTNVSPQDREPEPTTTTAALGAGNQRGVSNVAEGSRDRPDVSRG